MLVLSYVRVVLECANNGGQQAVEPLLGSVRILCSYDC